MSQLVMTIDSDSDAGPEVSTNAAAKNAIQKNDKKTKKTKNTKKVP